MNIALERRQLSLYPLRLTLTATEPLALDEHPGSSLRGALFSALLRRFCVNPTASSCAVCPLNATCPVAGLVAPLRDERPHGRDVPRPFVLEAPAPGSYRTGGGPGVRAFAPGQSFRLGLTLIGVASRFFPYVALAAQVMEAQGMGRPLAVNGGRRGRFQVERIDLVDPFATTGGDEMPATRQTLYTRGSPNVTAPTRPVTAQDIAAHAASLPDDRLTLRFLSPTRLVEKGSLTRTPQLPILVARLAERLDALADEYGVDGVDGGDGVQRGDGVARGRADRADRAESKPAEASGGSAPGATHALAPCVPSKEQREARREHTRALMDEAARLRLARDDTRWVDVASYSARQGRATPIGGFVGVCAWRGDVSPALRELLAWGELLHVGKNAVKGDGQYRMADEPVSSCGAADSGASITRGASHPTAAADMEAFTATTTTEAN